ncbi:MAG: hypothetical protein SCM96_15555 [Acidobacteriota bacterium]|nr:hypothetical protein [Acidobacteriota bacterium]
MMAPEPHLSALLEVIYRACLRARFLGDRREEMSRELQESALSEIRDLMEAVHNIPLHLTRHEDWDEDHFRMFLDHYDENWGAVSGISLRAVYEDALAAPKGR